MDTKKKELVGAFRNAGRTWRPKGQREPVQVQVHDFPHLGEGKAIPYGTYDVMRDRAVVNVGITHDTAQSAVESLGKIIPACSSKTASRSRHQHDTRRFINPHRSPLDQIARTPDLTIALEHRLFSHISIHWRGQPLKTYETVVNLIGTPSTRTGLKVKALLDRSNYETASRSPMNK